jgi:hypothetical protein
MCWQRLGVKGWSCQIGLLASAAGWGSRWRGAGWGSRWRGAGCSRGGGAVEDDSAGAWWSLELARLLIWLVGAAGGDR